MKFNNRQQKKIKSLLKDHNFNIEYFKEKDKQDRVENIILGLLLVFGIPILNWVLPKLSGTFLSTSINPRIGPIDMVLILTGIRFVWKGWK